MCAHVRRHFARQVARLSIPQLRLRVIAALGEATSVGLISCRDSCRYLGLAVAYDWDALSLPWVAAGLRANNALSPSDRLGRVIDEALFRMATAENDRRLEEAFGRGSEGTPMPSDGGAEPDEDTTLSLSKGSVPTESRGGDAS